ncbi:MAG: protein kinase domain-containing protein [Prochlorotrichaceae cyanobacterium]
MTYSGSFFTGYTPPGIESGAVLANRYRVVSTLGQGGFGRTYLASDSNRFNESCVLKEFAPQVQHPDYLQKAQDLFEREAGVLYRLEHSQIPRFRELFQTHHNDRDYLLLVQDYIQGQTYRDLLLARQRQGVNFSEAEVTQLLQQLLPVLAYIHANGVIHRDISPDNLMRREADGLPILIDFGGVKQAAASVVSQFSQVAPESMESTRLGKVGYAPPEQLQQGLVYPHSDLYALGVTALVLLTGQEPQALLNPNTLEWQWRSWINVSPNLAAVFDRLLVYRPSDRFPSATAVLLALNGNAAAPSSSSDRYPTPAYPATSATIAVGSPQKPIAPPTDQSYSRRASDSDASALSATSGAPSPKSQWDPAVLITFLLFILAIGIGSWVGVRSWLSAQNAPPAGSTPSVSTIPTTVPTAPAEWNRDQTLLQQAAQDGIDPDFFRALVDDRFVASYGNQSLTLAESDAPNRENWNRLGQEWLATLKALPKPWRSTLGDFSQADFERWVAAVNQKRLSSRALIDLVDNTFFQWFPTLSEGNLTSSPPLLQLWFSLADTTTQDLLAEKTLGEIRINPNSFNGRVSGKVEARQGSAYIANLQTGDKVRVTLTAENTNTAPRWSIYSPQGATLLEKSDQNYWEGTLTETGFYEFVVLAGDQGHKFSLDLIAEPSVQATPTPTPVTPPPPTPEATLPPEGFQPIEPGAEGQPNQEGNEADPNQPGNGKPDAN